jgi:predicted site-specific integrase-resolvase
MTQERYFKRHELLALWRVSGETFRRWRNAGKIPPPDLAMTKKSQQWKESTLRGAGLNV